MGSGQKISSRGHNNIEGSRVQQKAVYEAIKRIKKSKYLNSTKKNIIHETHFCSKKKEKRCNFF